jgi:MFS family permease
MTRRRARGVTSVKAITEYVRMVRSFSPNARRYLVYTTLTAVSWSASNLTFNLYLLSLGHSQGFIGWLNGLPSLVVLCGGLPIGIIAGRVGYRRFMVVGSLLGAVSTLGLGIGLTSSALVVFALMGGMAMALSWVIGAPMLMSISTKEERVFLFSVQQALIMGSGFVGSLVAGFVPELVGSILGVAPTSTAPLRFTYLIGASFNILAVAPIIRMRQVNLRGPSPPEAWVRSLPASGREMGLFAKILGPSAFISFGAGAMVVFFQMFFRLRFNLNPGSMGILFAWSSVVTAAATLASPLLAKRLGKVRTIVLTQLISIPFLLLLAYSRNLPAVVGAYYFRNALMNMSAPLQTTFGLELVREEQRATLTSLQVMLGSLGRGGLGPIVSGYLQERSGGDFTLAFTMTTVCYVAGTSLYFLFFRRYEDRTSPAGRRASIASAVVGTGEGAVSAAGED